jgi:hypothetical protein
VVSHISRKTSEMWGTRHWCSGRSFSEIAALREEVAELRAQVEKVLRLVE